MKNKVLSDEEKDILDSYDRGEWKPVKNSKQEIKKLREYACSLSLVQSGNQSNHAISRSAWNRRQNML